MPGAFAAPPVTFVVGIKRFGTAAIIADSLLTSLDKAPNPGAIKSGVLFPGCIFGICGAWEKARGCIRAIQAQCAQGTPSERFEELDRLIVRYQFPIDNRYPFEILLSSRHTGTPEFYLIDSENRSLQHVPRSFITLGEGKKLLDNMLTVYSQTSGSVEHLQRIRRQATEAGHPILDEDFAHLYAFQLYQSMVGAGGELARVRTGGYVHFVFQDSLGERRQRPRVYMVGQCDENGVLTDIYAQRLAFDHDPLFGDLIVTTDLVGRPPTPRWGVVVQNNTGHRQVIDNGLTWFASIQERQMTAPLYEIFIAARFDHLNEFFPVFLDRLLGGAPVLDLELRMQSKLIEFFKQQAEDIDVANQRLELTVELFEGWARDMGWEYKRMPEKAGAWALGMRQTAKSPPVMVEHFPATPRAVLIQAHATDLKVGYETAFNALSAPAKREFYENLYQRITAYEGGVTIEMSRATDDSQLPDAIMVGMHRFDDGLSLDSFANTVRLIERAMADAMVYLERRLGSRHQATQHLS